MMSFPSLLCPEQALHSCSSLRRIVPSSEPAPAAPPRAEVLDAVPQLCPRTVNSFFRFSPLWERTFNYARWRRAPTTGRRSAGREPLPARGGAARAPCERQHGGGRDVGRGAVLQALVQGRCGAAGRAGWSLPGRHPHPCLWPLADVKGRPCEDFCVLQHSNRRVAGRGAGYCSPGPGALWRRCAAGAATGPTVRVAPALPRRSARGWG